jgi:hypothetical protein
MTTPCITDPSIPLAPNGYPARYHKSAAGVEYWHAHRWALAQALGRDLLPGEQACHACNRRACLSTEPGHLYAGTQKQNEADKARPVNPDVVKIMGSAPRPSHAGQVPAIRARHQAGMPIKRIARELAIPRSTVADIVYYRTWKSLEEAG